MRCSGQRGSTVEEARQVISSLSGPAMDIFHPMALTRDVSVLKSQRPAEGRGPGLVPADLVKRELKSLPWVLTLGSGAWWSQITGLFQASTLLLQTRLQSLWSSPLPLLAARRDCYCAVPCHALSLATAAPLGDCIICSAAEQRWGWGCTRSLRQLPSEAELSEHTAHRRSC